MPPLPMPPQPMPAARLSSPDLIVRAPQPQFDPNDEDSVGSTMAITPEAAAQLLARGNPAQGAPPAQPPMQRAPARTGPPNVPMPAPPPPMPPVVAPAPQPPARPAPIQPPPPPQGRHGTMEMNRVPDADDDETGGGTMIIQAPDNPRRR